tara:strand:- start:3496 stop:3717 length:222 start_codon:yes stop_codon:yes gene_type:complete
MKLRKEHKMVYCDFIAFKILENLKTAKLNFQPLQVSKIYFDLNTDGSFRSTTKTIFVKDSNGTAYKIQVEELR